jgi:hypothetical protein
VGLEDRYRYPWKPPYAPGWLLGWPCVRLFDGEDEEDGRAFLYVGQDDVWQGDGMTDVSGGYDGNDNAIPLYLQ